MIRKSYIFGLVALTTLLIVINQQVQFNHQVNTFQQWKQSYGILISSEDQIYRRTIFQANLAKIQLHNSKQGNTYTMGINAFAHLTHQQFIAMYLESPNNMTTPSGIQKIDRIEDYDWIDWEAKGAVSFNIPQQGSCSSSYAFAAVGSVEGFNEIVSNRLREFSTQQVLDCSRSEGNGGCNGGSIINTLSYIQKNGLTFRASYPYHASEGQCFNPPSQVRINGYKPVTDCNTLMNSLQLNPIAVMVDGTNMQFYQQGIFTNCDTSLNFNMLLTAYRGDYFSLRSSWGNRWGQFGYIRIPVGNSCGVCQQGAYPSQGW